MKNIKWLVAKCSGVLCMVAMFIAIHSVNTMCVGKFYQPIVPKNLYKLNNK